MCIFENQVCLLTFFCPFQAYTITGVCTAAFTDDEPTEWSQKEAFLCRQATATSPTYFLNHSSCHRWTTAPWTLPLLPNYAHQGRRTACVLWSLKLLALRCCGLIPAICCKCCRLFRWFSRPESIRHFPCRSRSALPRFLVGLSWSNKHHSLREVCCWPDLHRGSACTSPRAIPSDPVKRLWVGRKLQAFPKWRLEL